ncbi:MAG: hypothetical protein HZB67_03735 [Candidatus Aenigmarchaeota archaeon]|nr:hypothetical protein [Candidatus Aenigmarchaeota archaeon]
MNRNFSQIDIGLELDKIIEEWDHITIFVEKGEDETGLRILIIEYLRKRLDIFFVFAYGKASVPAYNIIAELNNENLIRENGYMFSTNVKTDGYGLQVYSWAFELFQKKVVI